MPQGIPESAKVWFTNTSRQHDVESVKIIPDHMKMPINELFNLAENGDLEAASSLTTMRSLTRVETFSGKSVNGVFDQLDSLNRRLSMFEEFVKSSGTEFAGKVFPVYETLVDPQNDNLTTATIVLLPCAEDTTAEVLIGAAAKLEEYFQAKTLGEISIQEQ